jgi:DNA-binding NtrC family response regulator
VARLLIIDHEEGLCQLLETAFAKSGYMVETVTIGQAAKEKIESKAYDIIISGIRMPEVTGIDLLAHARATKSRAPFILMTAVPSMGTAISAVNLGAYRYVIKTESLVEELRSIVEGALKGHAVHQENSGCP